MAHSGAQHFQVEDKWGFTGGMGSVDGWETNGPKTTEWEDALVKHKIISKRIKLKTVDKLNQEWRDEEAEIDELDSKTLDELEEMEDELDRDTLMEYRRRRFAEVQEQQAKEKFGSMKEISKVEFVKEVAEESAGTWVVCCLYEPGEEINRFMVQCLSNVASRHKDIKFVKIVGNECIPGYPARNCPTLLLYNDGVASGHLKGTSQLGGQAMTADTIEWELSNLGCWESDQDDDPFKKFARLHMKAYKKGKVHNNTRMQNLNYNEDEDSSDLLDL